MKHSYFVQRFESLRGLAALMVAASHSLMVFRLAGPQAEIASVLGILCNGWAAVTLFFVLSGFVLGLALRRAEAGLASAFFRYAVRRVFRIYPAFLCSTILVLAWLLFGAKWFPAITHWLDQSTFGYHEGMLSSEPPLTWPVAFRNLFLLDSSLNLVTWTLKVEMGCSLLLALLHYSVRRFSDAGKVLVLLGTVVLACLGKWLLLLGCVRAEAVFDGTILKYVFLFYLGYLLPVIGPRCFKTVRNYTGLNVLVLLSGLGLFFGAHALHFGAFQDDLRLVQGIGASMILASILYGAEFRCFKLLDHPIAAFYGRISYSFYLLHDLTLIVSSRFFVSIVPESVWNGNRLLVMVLFFGVSTAAATGLALASYSFVERPFMDLAKKILSNKSAADADTRRELLDAKAALAHPYPDPVQS